MTWEAVIGLEVHVQLDTQSKLFSGASTAYGAAPNTQACAVDLGLPGTLPVLNNAAVDMAIKLGLALNATINPYSIFARKNYFYPDLPKGYQISQFEHAIVEDGSLAIQLADGSERIIDITRAHLEEDAGKSVHDNLDDCSGIDLNRAGTPLIEVVSEPVLRNAEEAVAYLKTLHTLVRYLGICDGNMQEGSFRCDANVSVRREGDTELGTRTETKNLNSFRFIEKAINYEIARQIDVLEDGGVIVQATRLYDPERNETRVMRLKEEANDYRYFPDPDLAPVVLTEEHIQSIADALPELPAQKQQRFKKDFGLSDYDSLFLISERATADYFEAVLAASSAGAKLDPKLVANWIQGSLSAALNRTQLDIAESPINPQQFNALLQRLADNTLSGKTAKQAFEHLWSGEHGGDINQIIEHNNLKQVTDTGAITGLIDAVVNDFPEQVQQYCAGQDKVIGFLIGQIMKRSQGKADPKQVNAQLIAALEAKKKSH